MKNKLLPLITISIIAFLQTISTTVKGQVQENRKNTSNSSIFLKDNKNSEIDRVSTGSSARSAYLALDADLNTVYKELRSLLAPVNQKKLKDWQMKWVEKNERAAKNTSDPDEKARLLLEATKTRLEELEELLSEIKMDADRELDFEENAQARHLSANGLDGLPTRNFSPESLRLTLGITLPPGLSYAGRHIRGMWPELRYRSTETNKKLLVCTFSEPEEGHPVEGSQTWHDGYYISPDGALAIIQAMDEEAFHSDGAQGQTCYYVYELPTLSEVPRSLSIGAIPKEIKLKPIRSLTKIQLAKDYPDASVKNKEEAPLAIPQNEGNELPQSSGLPEDSRDIGISMPREFVGTWDSRPMSEESQVVITPKEIRYYLSEVVGKITKITRMTPHEVVCELECTEIDEKWKDVARLKLQDGGNQLKFNDRDEILYRSE